ncbi:MAG: type II toxin-antitoxin system prevent-host-death family antitoxin [Pseudomonadota bacterium]
MKTVTASDANRQFSSILREVSHGKVITVTLRGRPVAMIAPARVGSRRREAARQRLLDRLHQQKATDARNWSRDELYE